MLIKTNYSGPYRIKSVKRGCTCPSYLDEINSKGKPVPPRKKHIHIHCSRPDGKGDFYLNGWDEDTLMSIDKSFCGSKKSLDYDWIEILENDQSIQLELF